MENFGSKFTALTAIASKSEDDSSKSFLTPKQWGLIVAVGLTLAFGVELFMRHAGL